MSRRHRRKRGSNAVEINLAAMLDMAFQLLAFFILTFRPAPVEGHLQLHMPPPVALTAAPQDESAKPNPDTPGGADLTTLDIYLFAGLDGSVSQVAVGYRSQTVLKGPLHPEALRKFSKHLQTIFDVQGISYDQVQLVIDSRLRYDELMKIVDVCTQQKLPNGDTLNRISFIDLTSPAE